MRKLFPLWAVFQNAFATEVVRRREDFTVDPRWGTFTTRQAPTPWPRVRKKGAVFDHFGFFNFQPDGHYVKVFVDDLEFSARASASERAKTVR